MFEENYYCYEDNPELSEKELKKLNEIKKEIVLGTLLAFSIFVLLGPTACFALDTKLLKAANISLESLNEEGFRQLYTTYDYRPKKPPTKALKTVIESVIDTQIVEEVIKEVVIRVSSVTNAENSVEMLNNYFFHQSTILIPEKIPCLPVPIESLTTVKPAFLRIYGGMFGEAMLTKYFLDKAVDIGRGALSKFGLTKDKLKKRIDDFEFHDDDERPSKQNYRQNGNQITFPSIPVGTIGPPAALLIFGLLALQIVNSRSKGSKSKENDGDDGLLGSVKVLTSVFTGIKFPKKKVRTTFEKMYDDTQDILYKMISPNQPYIWILLISFIIWWNSKKLGVWFAESDAKYLGGQLMAQSRLIAVQASIYADGLTKILNREQSSNDDYKAAIDKATKAMSKELDIARSNIMDLALEGAEFKRVISIEQAKLTSCAREVTDLLTYQGLVSEKLVSQSNSLSITDSNNKVIDVSLQTPRVVDDRFDLYVAPIPEVKKGFFF
jgi:hypothetical protein